MGESIMGISTSILEDLGVLQVKYSPDPVTGEDLAGQRRLVAEAISGSNIYKILIDASGLERFPSPFTVLEHNKDVVSDEVLRKAKFAVVCATLGENERCLEHTGVNRGVKLRCFVSREEALSWLGEPSRRSDVGND
jgi:hypothetical protein